MTEDKVLLQVIGLKKYFGGLKAVDGVDLSVKRGETMGLIERADWEGLRVWLKRNAGNFCRSSAKPPNSSAA